MASRFEMPEVGAPTAVRFPEVRRDLLPSGLGVWSIARPVARTVTATLVVDAGTSGDPSDRPGLASLAADLMDEGAAGRDAIQLSDALAKLGGHLEVEAGADVVTISLTTLTRFFGAAIGLLADVVVRPHLHDADFARVRDLRLSRLRQLSRAAGPAADRAFLDAVFGAHPYGHGAMGTSRSLEAMTVDEARTFWQSRFRPSRSTLVIAGDVASEEMAGTAGDVFGDWTEAPGSAEAPLAAGPASVEARPHVRVVDRPGAPQSELRVGHLGPPRKVADYHALVTLNALLGGEFTSRINRNLRETRGITYGASTAFEMRRAGGTFSCETSVQADATADAIREILAEFRAVRGDGAVGEEELAAAKASLTRGYVRNFETAAQLTRAVAQLAIYDLPPDTYDRFVPAIGAVTAADITRVARTAIRPDECATVVVGDAERCREALERLGYEVVAAQPEF